MHIHIVAVGRLRQGAEADLMQEYIGRLPWHLHVKEVTLRDVDDAVRAEKEAGLLLKHVPEGATLVALDERGKMVSSRAFASQLSTLQEAGVGSKAKPLVFAIGGAKGHGRALLERADRLLSLSHMTLPHKLARIVLAEQLYRASTLLSGHPYHRD